MVHSIRGEGQLKRIIFALFFLIISLDITAQNLGDSVSEDLSPPSRPNESDLLIPDPNDALATNGEEQAASDTLPSVGIGDFLRMIFVLAAVIGLIYVFFWVLKKFSGVKAEGEDAIRLLSTRPLKADAALHLVEVGTKVYMVGSTSNAVNLIAEIEDKESLDELHLRASRRSKQGSRGFFRLLREHFAPEETLEKGPDGGSDAQKDNKNPSSFLQRQRERLKDL